MTAPPSVTLTAEPLPGTHRQVGVTAPTSKREALRWLRAELDLTGPQAHALYISYERDVADAVRIGNDTDRADTAFVAWLMRQAPSDRKPSVQRWKVLGGTRGAWAVRS